MTRNKRVIAGLCLLFALVAYFPLFLHLDALPLRIYDESRLGVNTLEMLDNGNWLVPHYGKTPDMWNLKPPLMIWTQVLSMKLLGPNVLALRLPAALFGTATLLLLVWYGSRRMGSIYLGLAMGTSLLCTPGYITPHVTRTGDYDALLCLLLLVQVLCFFEWLWAEGRASRRGLYGFAMAFSAAVLCKGIAGCFLLPGLLLGSVVLGRWKKVLFPLRNYLVAALAWMPILAYYLGREGINPGYLRAVWENEIGGRYAQVIEHHQGHWSYYLGQLGDWQWAPWLWWVPLALWGIWVWEKDPKRRALSLFVAFQGLGLLGLLSLAQTKLTWYIAPSLPLFAITLGTGFYALFSLMARAIEVPQVPLRSRWALLFLALAIWGRPYWRVVQSVYHPVDTTDQADKMRYGHFFKRANLEAGKYLVPRQGYNSHLAFFQHVLSKEGIQLLPTYPRPEGLPVGTRVILCEEQSREFVHAHYDHEILRRSDHCELLVITTPKPIKGHLVLE
ncbi:MAG: glycosyltransferase family 39 protein [Bacteroidota bacterium]